MKMTKHPILSQLKEAVENYSVKEGMIYLNERTESTKLFEDDRMKSKILKTSAIRYFLGI